MSRMTTAIRSALTAFRSTYTGRSPAGSVYGSLTAGGITNNKTGMGTGLDNTEASFFQPTRVNTRHQLEILRVQSWAARKFFEIPVDDMLMRWREWMGDEGDRAVEMMQEAEERHQIRSQLRQAMIAARQYGTSLMIMVTKEAALDTPLMLNQIRPGDLVGLPVFDRFSASVHTRNFDYLNSSMAGVQHPELYRMHPLRGDGFYVHSSRVLRFDGIMPPTADGFTIYDWDWGISEIIPAMLSVLQDQTIASAAAHLTQVASIPVLGIASLRDAIAGKSGDLTAEQIGEQINANLSIFRLLMFEKGTEEFNRVAVNFGGFDKIQQMAAVRLAASADIPYPRFFGQSPGGLNSTGEGDWRNYCAMIEGKRQEKLGRNIRRLDEMLARDAGVAEVPDYEWSPLMDIDQAAVALTSKTKAEALQIAAGAGMIDEDDGRTALDGDPTFGPLEGEACLSRSCRLCRITRRRISNAT